MSMGRFRVLLHNAHLQLCLLLLPSIHTVVRQVFFPISVDRDGRVSPYTSLICLAVRQETFI